MNQETELTNQNKPDAKPVTRRELLKILTATGGAVTASYLLPNE